MLYCSLELRSISYTCLLPYTYYDICKLSMGWAQCTKRVLSQGILCIHHTFIKLHTSHMHQTAWSEHAN